MALRARIADGVLVSLVNFAATLVFFLASTVAAVLLLPADLFGKNFTPLLRTGFLVIGGVMVLVLGALIFPDPGLTVATRLFRLIPNQSPAFLAFRNRLLTTLDAEVHRFRNGFEQILRTRKWSLVAAVLVTLVLFSNKYVMGYAVARALGQQVPFGIFFGLQIIQLFLIYYAPTPGASGIAELSSVWLMQKIMPDAVLLIYAVSWRFVTTVLGAVFGGAVLLLDVGRWSRGRLPRASTSSTQLLTNATDSRLGERH